MGAAENNNVQQAGVHEVGGCGRAPGTQLTKDFARLMQRVQGGAGGGTSRPMNGEEASMVVGGVGSRMNHGVSVEVFGQVKRAMDSARCLDCDARGK